MNLTLNEKLRFQKQAGIINESQYKKLLKEEEEMTPTTAVEWRDIANILEKALSEVNSRDQYATANTEDVQKILNYLIQNLS